MDPPHFGFHMIFRVWPDGSLIDMSACVASIFSQIFDVNWDICVCVLELSLEKKNDMIT